MTELNYDSKYLSKFPEFDNSDFLDTTVLNLSNNRISSIPSIIGKFENLEILILRNNRITSLPPEIENLKNLETLNLENNLLKIFPKEIFQLGNLMALYMAGNRLAIAPSELRRLTSLVSLDLSNNQLEHIADDILELKKLKYLQLSGNKLPLPGDMDTKTPKELIAYVLENQKHFFPKDSPRERKESLPTDRAYLFKNLTIDSLKNDYGKRLNIALERRGVECVNIERIQDLDDKTTVVFIIVPFDLNDKLDLIWDIIDFCQLHKKKYHILLHSRKHATGEQMNLEKMTPIMELREELEVKHPDYITEFESPEHILSLIMEGLKQHAPEVRIRSLRLENIGHFSSLEIILDNRITCFEGENGTGKTTILRALALGLIGSNHKSIDRERIKNLLLIKRLDESGNVELGKGGIELDYMIDGREYTNRIEFNPVDEGRDIEIVDHGDFSILSGAYHLKSLIIGFPQTRGEMDSDKAGEMVFKPLAEAHIDDIAPLLVNKDELRLQSFSAWIANLDNAANRKEKKYPKTTAEERRIINKTFEIISQVTDHEMSFYSVRQASPPDIWVATRDAPDGISLHLISQGFKVIIGWIGYFVQRLVQAYSLSKEFWKEYSVVLVDEIDSYLHPKWQAKLIQTLLEYFSNTQFIISTHSPLMLGNLRKDNIYLLDFEGRNVRCFQPSFNPYGADANRILRNLMGQDARSIEEIGDLLKEYSNLAESGELDQARKVGFKIKKLIDPDDPEVLKTDVLIQAKEVLSK